MDLEQLGKPIERYAAWLGGLVVLLSAVVSVKQKWLDLFGNPLDWSWREFTFAACAGGLLAVAIAWSRRAHSSRLIDPDAFRLDPRSPDQFVGRADDLRKLSRALANPLVFLVGESGCGKSALLEAGVLKSPEFADRFLPIYIDMSSLDWEDGPLRALREGFARALPPDDSARTLLNAQAEPEAFSAGFREYYRHSLRRTLLLLDQFDDYQAQPRHRERFLPHDTGVWRSSDEIAGENKFWQVLRSCLKQDVLSVVIACREDTAAGLDSVRLLPFPANFALPRLERGYVRQLIDRLTERPPDKLQVIVDPANGWTSLRDHLVDDLEARGSVLPQQLKVVLGGLRTLRRLTLADYARADRLAGLEATFVAGAVERAVRASGLRESNMLSLLVELVDLTRQPPDKTPPRTTIELARSAIVAEAAASRALGSLQEDEIVRPRGVHAKADSAWQLDHAYLAQPILRIRRDRDQWRLLLADRAHAYTEAGSSLRHRWGALLTLGDQARLAFARLRGRFRYGEYGLFALESLLRGVPPLVAGVFLAALVWGAVQYDQATRIEGELASANSPLTDDAVTGLADLAEASWVARWRVEKDIFTRPEHARWFDNAPGPILRALVGLDLARLAGLARAQWLSKGSTQPDNLVRRAEINLAIRAFPGPLKDGDPQAAEVLGKLRDAMAKSTYPYQLQALAQAYAAVSAKLKDGDPQAAEELGKLRDAMAKSTYPDQLQALAHAYAAASERAKLPTVPMQDIAMLRAKLADLRDEGQFLTFAQAIMAATSANSSPLDWKKTGLIVTDLLLRPLSEGKPTAFLVDEYEQILKRTRGAPQPPQAWSGDMWLFVAWARANLPSFNPHRPTVDFLPPIKAGS